MGLFDFIKNLGGSPEAKIQKACDTIKNAKAIREDRLAAIEFLAEDVPDTEKAVKGLLQRFEFSLEHGINDTREKEKAMVGIIRHGEKSLPIVIDHLKHTTRIAWPIKILKALGKGDEFVADTLILTLDYDDTAFDQGKTDKNYDILCHLVDFKKPGMSDKVVHFLKDPDERVRYATTEVLMEQNFDEIAPILEPLLQDQNPDNSRIRQTIIRKYLDEGWTIHNPGTFPNRAVAGSVYISDQNKLYLA